MTEDARERPRATDEATLLLRLWVEPHDDRVRARLLTGEHDAGTPLLGVERIVEAVEEAVRAFARAGR